MKKGPERKQHSGRGGRGKGAGPCQESGVSGRGRNTSCHFNDEDEDEDEDDEGMPRLLIATKNAHKTSEIRAILGDGWEIEDLTAHPEIPAPDETGATFAE